MNGLVSELTPKILKHKENKEEIRIMIKIAKRERIQGPSTSDRRKRKFHFRNVKKLHRKARNLTRKNARWGQDIIRKIDDGIAQTDANISKIQENSNEEIKLKGKNSTESLVSGNITSDIDRGLENLHLLSSELAAKSQPIVGSSELICESSSSRPSSGANMVVCNNSEVSCNLR